MAVFVEYVDERPVGPGRTLPLFSHPAPPCAGHVRSLAPPRAAFLKLIECRSKKRHTALRLPAIRRLRIAATIFIFTSGTPVWPAINTSKKSACTSRTDAVPLGFWGRYSASCRRCIPLMAELETAADRSAASRRDAAELDGLHYSLARFKEHGFGINPPPKIRCSTARNFPHSNISGKHTNSTQVKSALAPMGCLFELLWGVFGE